MCAVRFIGCLHIGHKNMAKHRGFQDIYNHDSMLILNWNSVVGKKDLTYILGDVTMENSEHYYILDQLNGRKIVVLGNHDRHQDVPALLNYVEAVAGMIQYKGCVLTHAPIHPNEVNFCRYNIHAHIHDNELWEVETSNRFNDPSHIIVPTKHKYINVDAARVGYFPKSLIDLGVQPAEQILNTQTISS